MLETMRRRGTGDVTAVNVTCGVSGQVWWPGRLIRYRYRKRKWNQIRADLRNHRSEREREREKERKCEIEREREKLHKTDRQADYIVYLSRQSARQSFRFQCLPPTILTGGVAVEAAVIQVLPDQPTTALRGRRLAFYKI